MNLSVTQQPSITQQDGILAAMASNELIDCMDHSFELKPVAEQAIGLSPMLPDSTLGLLESRLRGMIGMIEQLHKKNHALRQILKERDAHIATVEQEKATLDHQVALFKATNGQVIAGLSDILQRFPGDDDQHTEEDEYDLFFEDSELLDETIGNA